MLGFKVVLKKWKWARRTLAQVADGVQTITTTLGVIMDQLTMLQEKADAAVAAEMAALDRIAAHEAADDAAIAALNEQKAALEALVADLRAQLDAAVNAAVDPAAVAAIADKLDGVVAALGGIDPAPAPEPEPPVV